MWLGKAPKPKPVVDLNPAAGGYVFHPGTSFVLNNKIAESDRGLSLGQAVVDRASLQTQLNTTKPTHSPPKTPQYPKK